MGVLYSVFPLGQDEHDEIASWLHSLGIDCPPGQSRYPTVCEIRHVLDHLDGYTAEYRTSQLDHWYASVYGTDDAGAFIVVMDYRGDDDAPHNFYFEKGCEHLNLRILERLARMCGPLVIVPATGADPIVVTPGLDLDQALQVWRH